MEICWDKGRVVSVKIAVRLAIESEVKDFPLTYGSAKFVDSSCKAFLLRFFKEFCCSDRMTGIAEETLSVKHPV